MRIVMLLLNDLTADTRVMKEASALASVGWSVTVVCLRGEGLPDEEERDGYRVRRVAELTSATPGNLIGKYVEMHRRNRALVAAAVAETPDVVHCHDTDTLPAGGAVVRATGAKLVYDAHELFLDQISGHGRSRIARAHWARVERRWIPCCDLRIAANEVRARLLGERYGVGFESLQNLPALESLADRGRLRHELGLPGDTPIVLYQGGLIPGRSLQRLVCAVAQVPGAHLVMQGSGSIEERLRVTALEAGVADRVHFMGHIAPHELHSYACGSNVGVVIYENTSLNNYYAAPNKLWAYLMAGIPVASSDFPGLRDVVRGDRVGVVFDPASEASIAEALTGLSSDDDARGRMGERARRLAEERYNWSIESKRLMDMYERLSADGGAAQ